jgi:hypothetical protein
VIIAHFTNHTLGILKLNYILYSVVEGRPLLAVYFEVYFEGIAANKQGIDGQWPPWPLLNSRPGIDWIIRTETN